MTELPLPGR